MTAKRKAIFLDKDGTLIPDIPYNVNPDLITLIAGVGEGLQLLKNAGFVFVVISNQAGVARGLFAIGQLYNVETKLNELVAPYGIYIEKFYFCPHHPAGVISQYTSRCNCRKPEPGMILQAAGDLNLDLRASWMIGDILNDAEAGNRAGCQTIVIENGNETEWVEGPFRKPTYLAKTFLEAAHYITGTTANTQEPDEQKLAAL